MNDLIQCRGKDCKVRCLLPTCEIKDMGGCYHRCTFRDAMEAAKEAGKKAYEEQLPQFIYRPPLNHEPLVVDVKVGYRFHEARVCRDCIYIRTASRPRKRLLYKNGVGCRGYDGRITNDLWVLNLRSPKLPIIKMKPSVRNR